MKLIHGVRVCALACLVLSVPASAATVYPNNPGGDSFNNSSVPFQAVGASGWYYNNVRQDTTIGINRNLPRSGNGSVWFDLGSGAGKADIEYYAGPLGAFSDLKEMSYDWYRSGDSTTTAHLHPSMRVLLDVDGNLSTLDLGYLIFELVYQPGGAAVPVNTWSHEVITGSTKLWNAGALKRPGQEPIFNLGLSQWQQQLGSAVILGFNSGVGSGWNGKFQGAVDNLSWTIGSTTTTTNFEAVPEPGTYALLGLGLAGMAAVRKVRK